MALQLVALVQPAQALDLQGHRGARGLAPENTLSAFKHALRLGVTTLELDVGVTRDGVLVVSHDPRLNVNLTRDAAGRWIDAPGTPINTLTLQQLQQHDVGRLKPGTAYAKGFPDQQPADGQPIPTLESVLQLLQADGADRIRLNVETKLSPKQPDLAPQPEAFAALVVQALRRHGLHGRATIQSFDWRTLRAVQQLAPEIPTAALTVRQPWLDNLTDGSWTTGLMLAEHAHSVPRLVKAAGARSWSPYFGELTEAAVAQAHALGLTVVPWTVNETADIERLIDWKVDGLISDRPDRVRAVMAAKGLPLPQPVPLK